MWASPLPPAVICDSSDIGVPRPAPTLGTAVPATIITIFTYGRCLVDGNERSCISAYLANGRSDPRIAQRPVGRILGVDCGRIEQRYLRIRGAD